MIADAARKSAEGRVKLTLLDTRLNAAPQHRLTSLSARLDALDRIRATLGPTETLKRGYAIVRGDGAVVTTRAAAEKAASLEVEFSDGRLALGAKAARKSKADSSANQGKLF